LNGTGNFYTQPFSVIKAGILPTINLLDFLTTSKPKKVIYAGTSESYAGAIELFDYIVPTPEEVPLVVSDVKNPRWSYAAAKTLSEVTVASVAQAEDFNFNIVRFHNVYGPRMGKSHVIPELMLRFKKNDFTIFGGENSRSFIYVDDAVDALILLLNDSKLINEIVNIGNEDLIRIYDLAILIQETLQIQGKIVDEGAPSGSPMLRCPNTKRLRSIGYKSRVELKEGLQKTLVFYEN
jgi:nucleoside-diphosphate-sugar epimerase